MTNRRSFLNAGLALTMATVLPFAAMAESTSTRSGMFEGRSNHATTGSVTIVENDGRTFVKLGEDFTLDSGPDPRVAFGNNGEVDKASYLGALLSLSGQQLYALPPTTDATAYNEVYIFCEIANVPLGVASLK